MKKPGRPKLDSKPTPIEKHQGITIKLDDELSDVVYQEQMRVWNMTGYSVPATIIVRKLAMAGAKRK